jgi:predicted kinase
MKDRSQGDKYLSYPHLDYCIIFLFVIQCMYMNKNKLVVFKGLPASGKSTEAFRLVKEEGYKRVNKDDLRAMVDGGKWSRKNEEYVIDMRNQFIHSALVGGMNIVVDDTNFAPEHEETFRQLAEMYNVEFEVKFFDTPVMECIRRDAKRGDKSVGAEVIMRMYNQYLKPKAVPYNKDLPQAFIFDIDSTLAIKSNRSPYDWGSVQDDTINESIANIFDALQQSKENYKMIIVSGRDSVCKQSTIDWLHENNINFDEIFMRQEGDVRKDSIIKREIYEENIKDKYNVVSVFDDRLSVCCMWSELGLTLCKVGHPYDGFF